MEKASNNSTVEEVGEYVTQIIVFSSGNKKTFTNVKTSTIKQGEFTQFELKNGSRVYINTKNVDFFEVIRENQSVETKDIL
ncbi:hypothetical protein J4477_02195 [Candidatus Pacearchaeota archaeon]|nr:hypothetical protein [Candidatus Pacearchaeota archaeon]